EVFLLQVINPFSGAIRDDDVQVDQFGIYLYFYFILLRDARAENADHQERQNAQFSDFFHGAYLLQLCPIRHRCSVYQGSQGGSPRESLNESGKMACITHNYVKGRDYNKSPSKR